METKETEQGRQYKEYTREATGNKAERSAQLLGGEFLDEPSGIAERTEIVMTIITARIISRLVLTIVFFIS